MSKVKKDEDLLNVLHLAPIDRRIEMELRWSLRIRLLCHLILIITFKTFACYVVWLFDISGVYVPLAFAVPWVLTFAASPYYGWIRITLGSEGFYYEKIFNRRGLVLFSEVQKLWTKPRPPQTLVMKMKNDAILAFDLDWYDEKLATGLFRRIEQAWSLAAAHPIREHVAMLVSRKDDAVNQWQNAIKKRLVGFPRGYRDSGFELRPSEAVSLLENPIAKPELRIGAALALLAWDESHGVRQIKHGAQAVASPRLRSALEAVAQGRVDEESIHLASLEAKESVNAQALFQARSLENRWDRKASIMMVSLAIVCIFLGMIHKIIRDFKMQEHLHEHMLQTISLPNHRNCCLEHHPQPLDYLTYTPRF